MHRHAHSPHISSATHRSSRDQREDDSFRQLKFFDHASINHIATVHI
jgi:hypothetical protein